MSPSLPPELLDKVVDHLRDDKRSLLACALVPGCLYSSRRHAFAELAVPVHTSALFTLLDLLRSSLNTIAPFTRRLVFEDTPRSVYLHGVVDVLRAVRNIPRLSRFLQHVSAVRFSKTNFDRVPTEIFEQLVYTLRGFEDIELHDAHFSRFTEVVDILCAFSCLKRVSLDRIDWTHGGYLRTNRPLPSIEWHLGSVTCGEVGNDVADWLCSESNEPIVRTLQVDMNVFCHPLLQRSSGHIHNLHITLPNLNNHTDACLHSIIHPYIALRALYISNVALLPADRASSSLTCHILSQIHSDVLEELGLELALPPRWNISQLDSFDLREICKTIRRPRYPSLRSIVIRVPCVADAQGLDRYVEDCMPLQKYILQIIFKS